MQGGRLRRRACVLCGEPFAERGRIDRMYCAASCRTLAWKARRQRTSGACAAEGPSAAPAPGEAPRGTLLQMAQRLEAEHAHALRELDTLRKRLCAAEEGARAGSELAARLVALEAQLRAKEEVALRASAQLEALLRDQSAVRAACEQLVAELREAQQAARAAPAPDALLAAQEAERRALERFAALTREHEALRAVHTRQGEDLSAARASAQAALADAQRADAGSTAYAEALRAVQAEKDALVQQRAQLEVEKAAAQQRAEESAQKLYALHTRLSSAQVARQLAEERAAEALRQKEDAEARLQRESAAHQAARTQARELREALEKTTVAAEARPTAERDRAEPAPPAEQVAAQVLSACEAALQRQEPARTGEVRALWRAHAELLRTISVTLVLLCRQMRAGDETDSEALAHRALDRVRQAMLRAADAPAAEALRRVFAHQRAVLVLLAQGIALRVTQEPAAAPWSACAGRALKQIEQRLRGLAGAASEVSGWLERYRPLLRQLGEAALERAQREPRQEAAPKRTRQLVEAFEEVAWRHFDTEEEAGRWAEQNGSLLGKLDELLG